MKTRIFIILMLIVGLVATLLATGCSTAEDPEDTNSPPNTPHSPDPADGSTSVNRLLRLTWECSDPDGDGLHYNVNLYVGPDIVMSTSSTSDKFWQLPDTLDPDTEYRWQVKATESTINLESVLGPFWTFTTGSIANTRPESPWPPVPAHLSTDQPIDVDLSWTCSDPDPGDTLTYDVFFGTNSPPPLVSTGQEETTYDPGALAYNTTYYWRILARDEFGDTNSGAEWQFTTEAPAGGEGVFAILSACRNVTWYDPLLFRVDALSARFDSAYAPCDPVTPLRPPDVGCNLFQLSWNDALKIFSYTQDPPDMEFLVLGDTYQFDVTAGGGVPALTESIDLPDCEPYVTSPATYSDVPVTGFTVTWAGHSCGGNVRLLIISSEGDSTGIDFMTPNDGSYTFTQQELSSITDLQLEYALIMIYQNMNNIIAAGYDPRSYIWGRILNTTLLVFTN